MPASQIVTDMFLTLRDALSGLAGRTQDGAGQVVLRQKALLAGAAAENCRARYGEGDVPGAEPAMRQAEAATRQADAANGDDTRENEAAVSAAEQAIAALNAVVQRRPAALARAADGFRGSLRVSPGRVPARGGEEAVGAGDSAVQTAPSYAASVAMLFPIEAATLFPLGQSIAGGDPRALSIVVALIVGFIVTLRYFATQESGGGAPAVREILVAVISFLLWVGALKGYWVKGPGFFEPAISAVTGAELFGFATIMWVAIVPYLIRKPPPAA